MNEPDTTYVQSYHPAHAIIATLLCVIGTIIGFPWYGFVAAISYIYYREMSEVATSDYQENSEWYYGFDLRNWHLQNFVKVGVVLVASLIVVYGKDFVL